jgi:hypothetical protein
MLKKEIQKLYLLKLLSSQWILRNPKINNLFLIFKFTFGQ